VGRIEKTVFISYRRANFPWALAIYKELHHDGYDVFFDYLSINAGDFETAIIQMIGTFELSIFALAIKIFRVECWLTMSCAKTSMLTHNGQLKIAPNIACTRTAGFTPPNWPFSGLQVCLFRGRVHILPAAGNASRYAALLSSEKYLIGAC